MRPPALALALAPALALAGCPSPAKKAPPTRAAITVTDDLGRQISLQGPARRIASLSPSNTEILFAVGCGEAVVLRDKVSSYPEAVRRLPATSPFRLSPGHVAGFSPDLVLLTHADATRVAALRRVGLTVATFDPRSLDQLYRGVAAIGALCGAPGKARALVASMRGEIRRVAAAVRGLARPVVYVETDGTDPLKPWTAGAESFVSQALHAAGGKNLVQVERPFLQISAEEVLTGAPDYILIMGVDPKVEVPGLQLLRQRPGWASLEAVKGGRVIDSIHPDLISRPGPRLVRGVLALARALHPGALP